MDYFELTPEQAEQRMRDLLTELACVAGRLEKRPVFAEHFEFKHDSHGLKLAFTWKHGCA